MVPKSVTLACVAALLACLASGPLAAQTPSEVDFLNGLPDFRDVRNMLPAYLNRTGIALLDERERKIAKFSAAQDIAARRAYVRERMLRALGGLPERTPLNARLVGTLDREGYRIEKIIFESLPGFYVTANLYLPKSGQPPYPAVLYPLGHETGGKSNPTWQQMLATLARRGYVGLAWDPLGQGERSQFYDPDLKESKLGRNRSTTEHTMLGAQCLLLGDNVARYTIWDGMRALDYLLSRPEVDPKLVAVTGNSGGGTHTAYLAALDDRLHVAAPSCYITSWRRLLESIGPQDAEQSVSPWVGDGLDHADFIYAFAPKPYLILSAIRDFFSISGARETYAEARRAYSLLGAEQKLSMFEADDGHGYNQPRRMAAYRWLGRWLKGAEDNQPETLIEAETEEALRATDSGQVMASLGGETVFSLNLKRLEQIRPARTAPAGTQALATYQKEIRRQLAAAIGFNPPKSAPPLKPFGQIAREGYRMEKLVYESEPGIRVPAVLLVPEAAGGAQAKLPAIVYVHGRGKAAGARAPSGATSDLQQLVKAGFVVLALDARGTGETGMAVPPDGQRYSGYFGDYASAMKAFMAGKTLVGMRATDIVRGVDLLAARAEVDAARIYGFGKEAGAVTLLHAAALDDRIRKVALEGMLVSYESVVKNRIHRDVFESIVPGALKLYDLPDLAAMLAPRPVWVVNAADPLGNRIATAEARKEYARLLEAFRALGAPNALQITERKDEQPLPAIYRELLNRD